MVPLALVRRTPNLLVNIADAFVSTMRPCALNLSCPGWFGRNVIELGSLPKTWQWQSGSSQSIRPSLSLSFRSVQISCSLQVDEQPSPSTVLPSSHCSLCRTSTMPLPHAGSWQVASQPSPLMAFPSSHCSPTGWMPLPQAVAVQLVSQPSPFTWLPSSHCSLPAFTPLPQRGTVQLLSQASPSMALPSSHSSP